GRPRPAPATGDELETVAAAPDNRPHFRHSDLAGLQVRNAVGERKGHLQVAEQPRDLVDRFRLRVEVAHQSGALGVSMISVSTPPMSFGWTKNTGVPCAPMRG